MRTTSPIEFKKILSWNFLLIFVAILMATIVDQTLNKQIELAIRSPDGASNMIWVWGLGSLASSMFFPLTISMLCAFALSNAFSSRRQMFGEKLELAVLENFRAWGKTFLWCFLLIIPGLIKYTYYLMSPFVVLFSKRYSRGEVDALEYSEFLSKKFWWRLNLWLAIFYFVIPVTLSFTLDEYRLFSLHPGTALASVLLESVLTFVFHFLILKLFLSNLHEVENGTDV